MPKFNFVEKAAILSVCAKGLGLGTAHFKTIIHHHKFSTMGWQAAACSFTSNYLHRSVQWSPHSIDKEQKTRAIRHENGRSSSNALWLLLSRSSQAALSFSSQHACIFNLSTRTGRRAPTETSSGLRQSTFIDHWPMLKIKCIQSLKGGVESDAANLPLRQD